jgi:hypothetical protein
MFRSTADWIATTPVSIFFQNEEWIVPTSQSIHIIGICVVFASTMMINLRLLGVGAKGRSLSQLSADLLPWVWRGFALLLLTGTLQVIAEPVRQFVTPAFWAKMLLVIIVVSATVIFGRTVRINAARWDNTSTRPVAARIFAVASSMLWIAIIVCGRLIGYTWVSYA